jgi:hypothetical protein
MTSEVLPHGVEISDKYEAIEDDVAFFVWSAKSEKYEISREWIRSL